MYPISMAYTLPDALGKARKKTPVPDTAPICPFGVNHLAPSESSRGQCGMIYSQMYSHADDDPYSRTPAELG